MILIHRYIKNAKGCLRKNSQPHINVSIISCFQNSPHNYRADVVVGVGGLGIGGATAIQNPVINGLFWSKM